MLNVHFASTMKQGIDDRPDDALTTTYNVNIENRMPLIIQLLATLIVCHKTPIKRNQSLILNKLLELYGYSRLHDLVKTILYINKRHASNNAATGDDGRYQSMSVHLDRQLNVIKYANRIRLTNSHRQYLGRQSESEEASKDCSNGFSLRERVDMLLEDQVAIKVNLMRLLNFCTYGFNSGTECKIQGLISVDAIADMLERCVMKNEEGLSDAKVVLTQLFFNVWLDTETRSHQLLANDSTWRILKLFEIEIKKYCTKDADRWTEGYSDFIFNDLCACINLSLHFLLDEYKLVKVVDRIPPLSSLLVCDIKV